MEYIEGCTEKTGYKVRLVRRGAFRVRGFTIEAPPGKRGDAEVWGFWDRVISDGRLAQLRAAANAPACVLGLGSWDPACPKGGLRYTICIEETDRTDFTSLSAEGDLFVKEIGASEWLCFELVYGETFPGRFWHDNPYKMMGPLGYAFHTAPGDYSIGLHFEAYPPEFGFGGEGSKSMEFWITVIPARAG